MIANLINACAGILLVYLAVLAQARFAAAAWHWQATIYALAIIFLARVARRSDYDPWHSTITTILGLFLLVAAGLSLIVPWPLTATTWIAFWVGLLTAFVSVWALLYRGVSAHPEIPDR